MNKNASDWDDTEKNPEKLVICLLQTCQELGSGVWVRMIKGNLIISDTEISKMLISSHQPYFLLEYVIKSIYSLFYPYF